MGVVFRAEDPQLQRLVALKAMLPSLAASESARQRFLREARAAAAFHHDHIVPVHQVGEDRGIPFLAMQFLEGEALDERLKREKKLPISEVLRIGREIALGLAAAHKRQMIHRDIKPANIWLEDLGERGLSTPRFRVKILDFGLARAAGEEGQLTQTGAIVGTPAYMAPEQAQSKSVDHRCDLFSLGCVLYRMAAGKQPFSGSDMYSTQRPVG
jgi:serine/threonine protein kinase